MSIYDFYPMKKRRLSLCMTPNGGRSASTLGKLKKKSEQLTSTVDAGIEVHWDNNSPSPTTTLALGKRRRKRKNNCGDENNEVTDISFVVQKLSENTSPVVDHTRSTLLEMWVNQEEHGDDYDKEFTSPPNQTRHEKGKAALATPLNQRRTSKRTTRKATRQFMLEIRKLVDEIQKSDINSSGNLSQRDSQKAKQQGQPRRLQSDEGCSSTITNAKPTTLILKPQTCTTTASEHVTIKREPVTIKPEPVTTESGREDSFEWTEDDMDELILTCQLSSSGKGSLDVPDAPKPHFGSSPSILTHVPETPMLSWDRDTARKSGDANRAFAEEPRDCHELRAEESRDRHELSAGRSRETKHEEEKSWDLIFGEDDSFLECAALEFELSQESFPKEKTLTKVKDAGRFWSSKACFAADQIPVSAASTRISMKSGDWTGSGRFPKKDEKTPKISAALSRVPSVPEGGVQKKNVLRGFHGNKTSAVSNDDCKKTINKNHNLRSFTKAPSSNCPADPHVSVIPLNDRPGNPMKKNHVKSQQNHVGQVERQQSNIGGMHGLRNGPSPNKPLAAKHPAECGRNDRMSVSSDEAKESQNDIECLLSGDNFAALLEDFNFEESLNETSCQRNVPVPSTNKVPLPFTNKAPLPSTNKVPLPSTNKVPLPSTNKAPLPSTSKAPLPSTNKAPLRSTNNAPLPSRTKAPLHFSNKTRQASSACKTSRESERLSTSSSQSNKTTYSKDEIERKRLEAQQRRLAKLRAASSQTRKTKMR